MSEQEYSEYNNQNRRWRRFLPPISELQEVIAKLERRMSMYELEALIRDRPFEDIVKLSLLHGKPVIYLRENLREETRNSWEGWIFKLLFARHPFASYSWRIVFTAYVNP